MTPFLTIPAANIWHFTQEDYQCAQKALLEIFEWKCCFFSFISNTLIYWAHGANWFNMAQYCFSFTSTSQWSFSQENMSYCQKLNLRLNKNERAKCECRQCLSKWEVQTWYLAPCQNRWDFGLLLKLVSPRFMDSTLSYGPKRKGPPSMEKGISDMISIVYLFFVLKYGKSRSFVRKQFVLFVLCVN